MRQLILTFVFSLTVVSMFAQANEAPKKLKYVTQAPDGSVAMTIYDDSRENTMKLESANTFYKYQIVDLQTGKAIFTASNKGKECTINKTKIAAGNYKVRLYTNKFIVTSAITVSAPTSASNARGSVAMND